MQYITYVETFFILSVQQDKFKDIHIYRANHLHDKKVTQYLKHVKIQQFHNYLFELILFIMDLVKISFEKYVRSWRLIQPKKTNLLFLT